MKKKELQIPFNDNGDLIGYYYGQECTLLNNLIFEDTLEFIEVEKGRSAVHFYFKRLSNETKLVVWLYEFTKNFIPRMINGRIFGKFTFRKQGSNIGCILIE